MAQNMELTPARTPGAATPRKSFALLQSPFEPVQPATERKSIMDPAPEAKLDNAPGDGQAPKPAAPPAANKILFLDGLRGLAAMAVIAQHSKWMGVPIGQPAVDLFFVLSAFLLTMIFEKKARTLLAEKANWKRWGYALVDYFVRRFLRVYPLFFVIALIIWALPADLKKQYFVFSHPEQFNIFKVLTFQFDYRYHVFWTLPLEIMYYFLIPVFVLVILLLRKFWIIPMIPLGYLVAYSGFYWTRGDHMPFKPHLPTFLCGSMAAIFYAKIDQFITKHQLVFRWYSWFVLRAIEMWCLLLLFSTLFNGLLFSWVFTNPIPQTPGGHFVSTNVSVIIICEMLLPGAVSSILEWSLLRYAGKVSYSMYLLHSFVVYQPWIMEQKWYDRFYATWALAFLLSAASYHVIEYPCQWFAGKVGKSIKMRDVAEKKRLAEERAPPQTPQQQPQPEPSAMV
jgi:peptidoglycan/LPS O-acetylase OafA/YrhL